MHRYEVLVLTVPELTTDEASSFESQFEGLIQAQAGTLLSFDKWGKYRLAYPISKHDYGIYFLSRFEVGPQNVNKLLATLREFLTVKYTNVVMRHMVAALSPQESLHYQRPESLEDAPAGRTEFFKNNSFEESHGNENSNQPHDT